MSPINTSPNVELTLDGLIMLFVDPKNEKCRAAVLREAPEDHTLDIKVFKRDAAGKFQLFKEIKGAEVKAKLELTTSNASKTGISRRKMDVAINRLTGPAGGNDDSFRWVVDFESEIYQKPIGAKKTGFASILTVNSGELLARSLSNNNLIIRRGQNGSPQTFGRVATQTGIDIVLDQPSSTTVFKNGDEVIFDADSQSRFQIRISRSCRQQPGGNDADSYYTAVGDLVPDKEKIFFSSDEPALPAGPAPPSTPDASCLGSSMSQSQI